MAEQITLFVMEFVPDKKKRIRYKIPTYKKFYSLYRYDRQLFRELLNKQLRGEESPLSQKELIDICLLRDNEGNLIPDSDEKHIFRYNSLHKVHSLIFNYSYSTISPFDEREIINIDGLLFYPQELQAEIPNTWQLSLGERLKLHIKLLRSLRKGLSIKDALRSVYE